MLYTTTYHSPIGNLTLVSDEKCLVGLWIKGQKYEESTVHVAKQEQADLPILQQTKKWLDAYFSGKRPSCRELPLQPSGGPFRQAVWKLLCEIPYGEVTTYGEIAQKIAQIQHKTTMSAQAVGGAVGHNPISIIIPCHRVIGKKGNLVGYAGGIEIKKQLLDWEFKTQNI